VVVSFGSMAMDDAESILRIITSAAAAAGVRAVVQLPGRDGIRVKGQDVLLLHAPVDHRALFPRAAAVVHHGGAGTTHTAAAAGVPQVVVPHVGDQPYWAARLQALGVATPPLPATRLAPHPLAERLRSALHDGELRASARRLGALVKADRGVATAIGLLEGLG
ncbi:MAG TPA: nucleotide disphospho-sugar-binding domain-containing protein, partial [Candidatus Limnocylindria bacterium]|nr:nucleotide disphospho-sugar-binding domain-containing protein [Candidatus Limnocylindria bacterium]